MRKFLKLIQENKPGISYIIDIKDTDDNLLGSAAIPGPTNTSFYEEFANYLENVHGAEVVGVNTERPVEDQEGPVEAMAQTDPAAAGLVQDRMAAEGEVFQKYADETSQIKQMASQM
tara:strand:- start:88 stop:438 length:351 start_codon:yes stop_codon:yes gene_type:complete